MRKEALHNRNSVTKLVTFVVISFLFIGLSPRAHAGVCDEDPPKFRFDIMIACKLKEINPLVSIQRTINDAATTLLTNVVSSVAFNSNPDDLGTCGVKLLSERVALVDGVDMVDITGQADPLFDATEIQEAEDANISCDFNDTMFGSRVAGSLMGVAKLGYDTVSTERAPVNLAYYVKHNLRKMPIVSNTAYAQTVSYNAFGLEFVIQIWEKTRNIAYAMMSVIMLIIGILIVTRKKINPQTVVSVQTALPRVVISLILITFSYPIGAVLISISYGLVVVVFKLILGFILQDLQEIVADPNLVDMNVVVMILTVAAATLGTGVVGLIMAMIMGILLIIALIAAVIKIIIITLKMLIAIIVAPIQFAISAIPGQENLIQDWFKRMISKVLAIPAIFFVIGLAWYFLILPFISPDFFTSILVQSADPVSIGYTLLRGARAVGSRMITMIMIPIMSIITMFYSFRVDKAIDEFVMGGKGKRR